MYPKVPKAFRLSVLLFFRCWFLFGKVSDLFNPTDASALWWCLQGLRGLGFRMWGLRFGL